MGFGFEGYSRGASDPQVNDGFVHVVPNSSFIEFTPDEARLYALKLLKAADKAEED